MYVYIYVYIHVYICIHRCICILLCIHTCIYMYTYMYLYTYMYPYVYIWICMRVQRYSCAFDDACINSVREIVIAFENHFVQTCICVHVHSHHNWFAHIRIYNIRSYITSTYVTTLLCECTWSVCAFRECRTASEVGWRVCQRACVCIDRVQGLRVSACGGLVMPKTTSVPGCPRISWVVWAGSSSYTVGRKTRYI